MPKFEFVSNARPSLFAYPPPTTPPKREAFAKVATVVLSTTAKVKAREKKKAADVDAMDTVRVVAFTMKRFLADSCGTADEKAEPKKDGDVEMKGDEVPSGEPADGSPSTKTPEDTNPMASSTATTSSQVPFRATTLALGTRTPCSLIPRCSHRAVSGGFMHHSNYAGDLIFSEKIDPTLLGCACSVHRTIGQ